MKNTADRTDNANASRDRVDVGQEPREGLAW